MSTIRINGESQRLDSVDSLWINQQINRRRHAGEVVCVQVTVDRPPVHITLSTPTCASGGGGGRPPNREEQELIDLWGRLHLNDVNFSSGNVVAFVKQLH